MPRWLTDPQPGQQQAVTAEILFLVNLLALPVVGFVLLAVLYYRHHKTAPPLAAAHLTQTFVTSVWGGILIVFVIAVFGSMLLLGDISMGYIWMAVIVYFTMVHSTLVVFGALGLARAMAGQTWRYPLIGPALPTDKTQSG